MEPKTQLITSDRFSGRVLKFIDASSLEIFTGQGWELIQLVEDETVQQISESEPIFCSYPGGGGGVQQHTALHQKVVRRVMCLVAKGTDARVAELREDVQQLEERLRLQAKELQAEKTAVKDLEKAAAEFRDMATLARQEETKARDFARQESAIRQKLECDLSRVRTAVGAKAFREFVEEET